MRNWRCGELTDIDEDSQRQGVVSPASNDTLACCEERAMGGGGNGEVTVHVDTDLKEMETSKSEKQKRELSLSWNNLTVAVEVRKLIYPAMSSNIKCPPPVKFIPLGREQVFEPACNSYP